MSVIIGLSILSYTIPAILPATKILTILVFCTFLIEGYLISRCDKNLTITRAMSQKLALGDKQTIDYIISNDSSKNLNFSLYDDLPFQLQIRDGNIKGNISSSEVLVKKFSIRPTQRGMYQFGDLNMLISFSFPGLIEWRSITKASTEVPVVPSFIQMKKYELTVFSKTATLYGIRRVRTIGENDEYEHTRSYITGDNIKSINWKATSRKGRLMVDQFQNSRSQNIYLIIDKGRSMKMPFDGLSLLDYSINSSLVLANIILKKHDRVGLITFSNKIGTLTKAEALPSQLELITNHLYNQKTDFKESDYRLLHLMVRKQVRRRSILMLFTNFESKQDMRRQLPYLINLNKNHLVIVIAFINTEIQNSLTAKDFTKKDIYYKTFARTQLIEKEKIMDELKLYGIQTLLTTPEKLSINAINRYLELKAKRMN